MPAVIKSRCHERLTVLNKMPECGSDLYIQVLNHFKLLWGQLHLYGSPTDIGHGYLYTVTAKDHLRIVGFGEGECLKSE